MREEPAPGLPAAVDRAAFEAELSRLRDREKAHTREADAIAAARRRLPMTEVDAGLAGLHGLGRALVLGSAHSYALMDLTVFGRQEPWEDSPPGWPQRCTNTRTDGGAPGWPPVPEWPAGRPIAQWPRLAAGHSDDLATRAAASGSDPGRADGTGGRPEGSRQR